MGGGVSRHTLYFTRRFNQIIHLIIFFHKIAKLRRLANGFINSDFKIIRHKLCHGIYRSIGHSHCAPYIANCRAGLQRAEGNYLTHMIDAVFFRYIIYNLLPAFIAKVNIEIGH